MFDLDHEGRLKFWKDFRAALETSPRPLDDVAVLWSKAPFVSKYLNPNDTAKWPDPWHLIIDNKYDDLAITLGICYTVALTERFKDSRIEIHTSMFGNETRFIAVVNDQVLNYNYREVTDYSELKDQSIKIWSYN